MELSAFTEFGVVIGLATVFAILTTKLRQPAILGYILAGLIIQLSGEFHPDEHQLELFSKIGITLLLFILGLELNINELKSLGKVAVILGIGQMLFSAITGVLISLLLGFSTQAAIFIGVGLVFSSTIVVVKLFSQSRELETLYGRLSIGILLMQDFAAILVIVVLSGLGKVSEGGIGDIISQLATTLGKGAIAAAFIFILVKFMLNPLLNWIHKDKEVLFFSVISWALLVGSLMGSRYVGFSTEMGGLIAGIALSNRFEHLQIESWVKPLRDFFLLLFFVLLGLQIDIKSINSVLAQSIVISIFIIISKPFIILLLSKMLGYSKKVSFFASIAIAQISEFSLIVAKFGYDMDKVNKETLTLLTIVSVITMTLSSYMIFYNEQLLKILSKPLDIFRFKNRKKEKVNNAFEKPNIILFGCHRMGKNFLNLIPEYKSNLLIIDYDPDTIKELTKIGYNAIYGDIDDIEVYENFDISESKIIISTVPVLENNKLLLNYLKQFTHRPMTIISANDDNSAKELYRYGADFVVYPHMLGSEIISKIVSKGVLSKNLVKERGKQLDRLNLSS